MIKVVVFDADGVVNHAERFSEQIMRKYGIPNEKMLPFFTGIFQKCLIGEADLKEEIVKYLPEWGIEQSVDEYLGEWFTHEHKVDQRIVTFIKHLREKGMRCYLATNQEKYRTAYMMEEMGFSQLFDGIFSSAHLGSRKPEKTFFQKVMQQLPGIQNNEVFFWDDTQEHVDAARRFGWHAEFYTTFDAFEKKMQEVMEEHE